MVGDEIQRYRRKNECMDADGEIPVMDGRYRPVLVGRSSWSKEVGSYVAVDTRCMWKVEVVGRKAVR